MKVFVIACCSDSIVYGYHPKLYGTLGTAEAALMKMQLNKKLDTEWKVYSAKLFEIRK